MILLSQQNLKWKNIRLGFGWSTIGKAGCYITSLAMLTDKEPPEVNDILKKNKAFSGSMIIAHRAAQALGLQFHGQSKTPPDYPCVAEVDFYWGPRFQMHFVVFVPPGSIYDSWDGIKKPANTYRIIKYFLFQK
jgi:hypothetical protein